MEQNVDISSGAGLGQGSSSSSSARPAEEDFTGVFRTFPMEKVRSAECKAGQCGPAPARQLMDSGGSARGCARAGLRRVDAALEKDLTRRMGF